jgi:hypothetical protein
MTQGSIEPLFSQSIFSQNESFIISTPSLEILYKGKRDIQKYFTYLC